MRRVALAVLLLLLARMAGDGKVRVEHWREAQADYIAALAADSVVRESDERELRRPFEEAFVNMGALPIDAIYRGVVAQRAVIDRGDTLDLLIVRDVEGLYVRKWGLHLLGGVATWRNHAGGPIAPVRMGSARPPTSPASSCVCPGSCPTSERRVERAPGRCYC